MPRSNGVVKKFGKLQNLSDEIKDSEAGAERLPIDRTSSGSFSRMPDNNKKLCDV
jgi:hypothetical protein